MGNQVPVPSRRGSGVPPAVGWGLALFILLLFGARGQINASVGRIELPGVPAFTVSGVTSPLRAKESAVSAGTAWCAWHTFSLAPPRPVAVADPEATAALGAADCLDALAQGARVRPAGDRTAARLVRTYALLGLAMLAMLTGLMVRAVRKLREDVDQDDPIGQGLCAATRSPLLRGLGGSALATTVVEAAAQWVLASPRATPWLVGMAGRVLAVATPARTAAVGVLLLLALLLAIQPRIDRDAPVGVRLAGATRGYGRPVGLLRPQLLLVGLVVLLLSGIGNTQIQDALLRWTDVGGNAIAFVLGLAGVVVGVAATVGLSLLVRRSVYRAALADDSLPDDSLPDDSRPDGGQPQAPDDGGVSRRRRTPPPPPVVLGLGAMLVAQWFVWPRWPGLGALGMLLVAVALLGWLAGVMPWRSETSKPQPRVGLDKAQEAAAQRAARPDPSTRGKVQRLVRWLAAVPLAMLGIALVRAAIGPLLVGPARAQLWFATVLGVLLVVAATLLPKLFVVLDRAGEARLDRQRLYAGLAAVMAGLYLVAVLPGMRQAVPVLIGPVGMAMVVFSVVLVVVNELQRWAENTPPVAGLRVLLFNRTPVFLLLAAWLALGIMLDPGSAHAVRTIPVAERGDPVTVAHAFNAWVEANCGRSADAAPGEIPMVFVAASGGGIRAAYWTAGALEKLFPTAAAAGTCPQAPRRSRVFAASGVSGGSLGIVAWLTQLEAAQDPSRQAQGPKAPGYQRSAGAGQWYDTALGGDHLSAAAAWMLSADLPRLLFGYDGVDRAVVLEQSWESTMPGLTRPFLATYQPVGRPGGAVAWTPLALLNGTSVESGCRLVASPLDVGTHDTADSGLSCRGHPDRRVATHAGAPTLTDLDAFLCGSEDVARSTAALLSARFPYISPSGRLTRCAAAEHTYVVDGGYVETSASLTAYDLYLAVKPLIDCHNDQVDRGVAAVGACAAVGGGATRRIRPVLIQIDNGYATVAAEATTGMRPNQVLVPLQGYLAAGSAAEFTARQRTFDAFGSGNYARVVNIRRPGVQAPLGWVLSSGARQDLEDQLDRATAPVNTLLGGGT